MFNDELQKHHYQYVIEKHICTSDGWTAAVESPLCRPWEGDAEGGGDLFQFSYDGG